MDNLYDEKFYSKQVLQSVESARYMLTYLFEFHRPQSIVEFGCGKGGWLAEAERLGATELIGYDGDWVEPKELLSRNIDFIPTNFECDNFATKTRKDLAISLEVAEHISRSRAEDFIDSICASSDVVLFGAAIKYQGGVNHLNEQRQSYWVNLFNDRSYECYDVFRSKFWNNNKVSWIYKQNAFLFVKRNTDAIESKELLSRINIITDIVHPDNYESRVHRWENPSWRTCLKCCKNYVRKKSRIFTRK